MNAGQRLTRRVASKLAPTWSSSESVCPSCRETLSHRPYSTAAAVAASQQETSIPPVTSTQPQDAYTISAGVMLSRPPILTRDLNSFEKAFFLYQRRLNERLALPFTRYFYIQKNTPADVEWKRKIKQRLTPARDIGAYSGYGKYAWNDELPLGAQESEPEWQLEQLLEDAKPPEVDEETGGKVKHEPIERPPPRESEADRKNDVRRLDRKMQETLYLLVQNKEGKWIFPKAPLEKKEVLHVAAERALVQSCGINMNTWILGNTPIGHYIHNAKPEEISEKNGFRNLGEKTFFMKGRIMAGQANIKDNRFGLQDFKWLSQDEVKKHVTYNYWHAVRNMLAER